MLNRMFCVLAAVMVLVLALPLSAFADDWVAVKLRGVVMQLVDGDWTALNRGDVVPDDRVIRTLPSGRVDFQRDSETISLGASTQIQIRDKTGQRYTTVKQYFGTVEVDAEVRNVKHFAVETPFLAAVVKGTNFVVKSGDSGASVKVKRGQVEVTDAKTGAHALVPPGQTATVTADGFSLKGRGSDKTEVVGAKGAVIGVAGVEVSAGPDRLNAGVTTPVGVGAAVGVGTGGVTAGVEVGDLADVDLGVGEGGIDVGVDVGSTNVGVSVGGGDGISVNVGGVGLSLGGLL